jgi:hypothetical protein
MGDCNLSTKYADMVNKFKVLEFFGTFHVGFQNVEDARPSNSRILMLKLDDT